MSKRGIARGIAIIVALSCFGYLGYYAYEMHRTKDSNDVLSKRTRGQVFTEETMEADPQVRGELAKRELYLLPQYAGLYKKNKNMIGWIRIEGTQVDNPVMKSVNGNGEYYLDHNFEQQEDRNGTLFMDDKCDVIRPSENWIIYGHNMKSGQMFGELDNYKSEDFYKKHPTVYFDTIYETGKYKVMCAFQSHVFEETEIAFKYYQFIDPVSSQEFDAGIESMKEQAFYDTGVSAKYGDRLLILSTCDYDEVNGRFVVVCVREEEA